MPPAIVQHGQGFGLGLRTAHYEDFLAQPQPVDWLEVITDNHLVEGGKPLVVLDRLRRDYPMAMHGVAMSIGAAGGLDLDYLARVKRLAARIEPLWVSDHLCWIGPGPEQLHDLYPLPYTDEAARRVIAHIRQAQDLLGRRLVIENVSSYIDYQASSCSEWQFLSHVANEADCLLLLDVNNVHVSSVNHGFDPLEYLQALPRGRVQQIHLAGHSTQEGGTLIDTHDHPVAAPVWALFEQARRWFGPVASMIERDAHIPPLSELLAELDLARQHAALADASASQEVPEAPAWHWRDGHAAPSLQDLQHAIAHQILADAPDPATAAALLRTPAGVDPTARLGLYHHAYRARLAEVLADTFAKTYRFMGSDLFDEEAMRFAPQQPPTERSLNRYGMAFPAYLAARYPDNPELFELAQLDGDLRSVFDGADVRAWSADDAQADAEAQWLQRAAPLHPSLRMRPIRSNVVSIWNAIHDDAEVPPVELMSEPAHLVVWRKGLQPHFQSVAAEEAAFLAALLQGMSITEACSDATAAAGLKGDPVRLSRWLQRWLGEGWLSAT
jgi:uncharacterized protein (UPF0276 family)